MYLCTKKNNYLIYSLLFLDQTPLPLTNRIAKTDRKRNPDGQVVVFTDKGDEFTPNAFPSNDKLQYVIEAGTESYLHSYFMQVHPLQENGITLGIKESPVPRYLQNVHGYFARSGKYPTELVLSNSWDSHTVKDNQVFFYRVDGETCEPCTFSTAQRIV